MANLTRVISNILVSIASIALFVMMIFTAADVVGRYIFNAPIAGTLELVEYLMAIIVPFSIVYCAQKRAHVAVELIVNLFPRRPRLTITFIMTFIGAIFVFIIGWQNYEYIFEMKASQMTSAVLQIPVWPFIIPTAVGMFAFAVILFTRLLPNSRKEVEDGPN